jgi:hypothetical protein
MCGMCGGSAAAARGVTHVDQDPLWLAGIYVQLSLGALKRWECKELPAQSALARL